MNDTLTIFEILSLAGALIGVYFKLSSEVQKLQGQVALLEKSESETKQILNEEQLVRSTKSRLLLASNQIK